MHAGEMKLKNQPSNCTLEQYYRAVLNPSANLCSEGEFLAYEEILAAHIGENILLKGDFIQLLKIDLEGNLIHFQALDVPNDYNVYGCCFGGKGDQFVLGSEEAKSHIWSSDPGELLRTIAMHNENPSKTVIQWNPLTTEKALFVTGQGEDIKIWGFEKATEDDIELVLSIPDKTRAEPAEPNPTRQVTFDVGMDTSEVTDTRFLARENQSHVIVPVEAMSEYSHHSDEESVNGA